MKKIVRFFSLIPCIILCPEPEHSGLFAHLLKKNDQSPLMQGALVAGGFAAALIGQALYWYRYREPQLKEQLQKKKQKLADLGEKFEDHKNALNSLVNEFKAEAIDEGILDFDVAVSAGPLAYPTLGMLASQIDAQNKYVYELHNQLTSTYVDLKHLERLLEIRLGII